MAKDLNPRVEREIRKAIQEISQGEWTISDTAAKLLRIGVVVRESGNEPRIEGPFGLPRPFAKINLSDQMTEIRTEIDNDLAERMTTEFDNRPNTAAREAIRLGLIAVAGHQFKIKDPEGIPRPFAQISLADNDNEAVRELTQTIRDRLA